jgi:splicing factor 45
MAAPQSQPAARSGMSLYANLLDSGENDDSASRDSSLLKDEGKDDGPAKKAIDPGMQ